VIKTYTHLCILYSIA
jgi:hypothetical protein